MEKNNSSINSWHISQEEKTIFINKLTDYLPSMRGVLKLSQEELSVAIGISRQTYNALEIKKREMSWSTYLSLVLFFYCNASTREILVAQKLFPFEKNMSFNNTSFDIDDFDDFFGNGFKGIIDKLDEQAVHSVKTLIMIEYSRCNNIPSETVIKLFEGLNLVTKPANSDTKIKKALKEISDKNG